MKSLGCRKGLLRNEQGFTLTEMLVTIMIMVMVLFALYSIFDMSIRVFAFGNDEVEAVENARVGLERMEREIRAAYPVDRSSSQDHLFFNANGPGSASMAEMPTATRITFGNEIDPAGASANKILCVTGATCEYITYKLVNNTLMRNSTSDGTTTPHVDDQPVVEEFVNNLNFTYLKSVSPDVLASNESEINVVRISLDVKVEGGEQDGTQTLTTDVTLRNRDLASLPNAGPADTDGDGVTDDVDACRNVPGDQADGCPAPAPLDTDGDTVPDDADNCSTMPNADQADLDADGSGNVCDDDRDGDGFPNASDPCPDSNDPDDGCPANVTGISVDDPSVTEGNSGTKLLTFTVTRTGNLNRSSTVQYATANGTATEPSDYTAASGTLTFAPNDTTKTVNVIINGDTAVEGNETFTLNLFNPTRANISDNQGVGTITNDDAAPALPTLSVNDQSVTEGNSGTKTLTFTVTRSGDTSGISTVQYATANGTATTGNSDYTATSGTLNFSAGATTRTVSVPVRGDTTVEPDEVFYLNLSSPTNATITDNQGIGTITNDDAAPLPSFRVDDQSVTEGNSGTKTLTFTVTRSGDTSGISTVQYATADNTAVSTGSNADYTATSGTLTFSAGETSKTVPVTIRGDRNEESNERFFLNLSSPTNATITDNQGIGTIRDDDD